MSIIGTFVEHKLLIFGAVQHSIIGRFLSIICSPLSRRASGAGQVGREQLPQVRWSCPDITVKFVEQEDMDGKLLWLELSSEFETADADVEDSGSQMKLTFSM